MSVFILNSYNGSNRDLIRRGIFEYIKANPLCDKREVADSLSISQTTVTAAYEYFGSKGIIKFNKPTRDAAGKLMASEKVILMDFQLNTHAPTIICSQCTKEVIKLKKSKHKDLCSDCTEKLFMSPKITLCQDCGVKMVRKEVRKKKGGVYCKICVDKLKIKPNPYNICNVCGSKYRKECTSDTCKLIKCKCGKSVKKSDAVKLTTYFCSEECLEDTLDFEARKFSDYVRSMFKKECAICGYDRVVHFHHIVEFSNGGLSTPENCIPLCPNHHEEYHVGLITQDYLLEVRSTLLG